MQYYGEQEVKSIDWNTITLSDDTQVTLTDKQLTYIITEEPKDLSETQILVTWQVVGEIMDLLDEHNVRKGDIDHIVQTIIGSYNENFIKATAKAFGTYDSNLSMYECTGNIRMSDIKNNLI